MVSLTLPSLSGTSVKVSNEVAPGVSLTHQVLVDQQYSSYAFGAEYSGDRVNISAHLNPLERSADGRIEVSPARRVIVYAQGEAHLQESGVSHDFEVGSQLVIPGLAIASAQYHPHMFTGAQIKVIPHDQVLVALEGHYLDKSMAAEDKSRLKGSATVSISAPADREGFRRWQVEGSLTDTMVARTQVTVQATRILGVAAELQANLRTKKTCLTVGYEAQIADGVTVMSNVDTQGLLGTAVSHRVCPGVTMNASVVGNVQRGSFRTGIALQVSD